jgi:hypothetical protein
MMVTVRSGRGTIDLTHRRDLSVRHGRLTPRHGHDGASHRHIFVSRIELVLLVAVVFDMLIKPSF